MSRQRDKFLAVIKEQLAGLKQKVLTDFTKSNFDSELAGLQSDPVYSKFAFDCPEYVLIRLMGRISISVGRRLGEIYDKVPRYAASVRFNLPPEKIAPKFDRLELDVGLNFSDINEADKNHITDVFNKYLNGNNILNGLGIEIRYNFNPNDSSRLRKDVDMGQKLVANNLCPIYLIFSAISPRQDAISRLTNSGWNFLIGQDAINFMSELVGLNITTILDEKDVYLDIKSVVEDIMRTLVKSHPFTSVNNIHNS